MKIVTPEQMNRIDSLTINQTGIPGIVLMENAALKVVEEIIKSPGNPAGKNIFLFAGKGNNGGDAFAAARHLYNKGARISVYITGNKKDISGDAAANLGILERIGINTVELVEETQLDRLEYELFKADLVVDGIFGTGLKGKIRGLAADVVDIINRSGKTVISIDIPSGINGETGGIPGICVKADKTVTFGLPKTGLIVHPGCEFVGELVVADIGIPSKVIDSIGIKINVIDEDYVSGLIPERYSESSKGDYGRVFVISGSTGMTGAGCLTAAAALRTGSGLVYLGVPSSLTSIYDGLLVESITVPLEDCGQGFISRNSINRILDWLKRVTVVAIGPGLSVNDDVSEVVSKVVESSEVPVVLDADALNVISRDISVLKKLKTGAVLTPHPGEMARLTGISIDDVQNNRIEVAREFAFKWKAVTVLKGAKTVIADPEGNVYINPTGNPGMATGGTGDVLTGTIASLIGQGAKLTDAAIAGVYLHGMAGDGAAGRKGQHGLIAGDLVDELPYVIKRLKTRK